jgi:hypothetical protein
MGLFEQQPLLMIPFILVVVAGYDVVKWGVRRLLLQRREDEVKEG